MKNPSLFRRCSPRWNAKHLRWDPHGNGVRRFSLRRKKNRFRRPGVRRDTSIGPGWRSLLIAVAFKVSSLWMVCDWTSNEASKHRTREKSEAAFRNSKEKKDGMRRESECTTDDIETMYESLSPVYKMIYILFYLSLSLFLIVFLSISLSVSLCAPMYACTYIPGQGK